MNISFRLCTEADLEIADKILVAAYQFPMSRLALIRDYYLRVQPDGWWLAIADNEPVGFGGAVDYGTCTSIGMLSILPEWQRRGIGTALMEHILSWCEVRQSPTQILEAEEGAVSLYERVGFKLEEITFQMALETPPLLQMSPALPHINDQNLAAIKSFDSLYFDADRSNVLYAHWLHNPGRAFVTHDQQGQVTGYLIARSSMLGPWIAANVQDAERLLIQALALPFKNSPFIAIPSSNKAGLALLYRHHFQQQGTNIFMQRGKPFSGMRSHIYGQASPALG